MWKLGEIDNKRKRKIKFGYNWDKHIIYCPNTDNFESEKALMTIAVGQVESRTVPDKLGFMATLYIVHNVP